MDSCSINSGAPSPGKTMQLGSEFCLLVENGKKRKLPEFITKATTQQCLPRGGVLIRKQSPGFICVMKESRKLPKIPVTQISACYFPKLLLKSFEFLPEFFRPHAEFLRLGLEWIQGHPLQAFSILRKFHESGLRE